MNILKKPRELVLSLESNNFYLSLYSFFLIIICILFYFIFFFYFTILYWFCHTSTCIRHRCTHIPHPEPLQFVFTCCSVYVSEVRRFFIFSTQNESICIICHYFCNGMQPASLSLSHTHTHTHIMRPVTFIFLSGWLDWVEFISMCPQLKVFRLTWSLLVSLNTFIFLF